MTGWSRRWSVTWETSVGTKCLPAKTITGQHHKLEKKAWGHISFSFHPPRLISSLGTTHVTISFTLLSSFKSFMSHVLSSIKILLSPCTFKPITLQFFNYNESVRWWWVLYEYYEYYGLSVALSSPTNLNFSFRKCHCCVKLDFAVLK